MGEEKFIRKLVELTYSTNLAVKEVCCFTLKNIIFDSSQEVKDAVLREITGARLLELLDKDECSSEEACLSIQEQALIMYRNFLTPKLLVGKDSQPAQHLCENLVCEELFAKVYAKLNSPHESLITNALYVLSSIA